MSKVSGYTELQDKVQFFVHGRSFSGRTYVRYPGDGLEAIISDATGFAAPEDEESLAQQQFKDESDPNVIMKQFARTGDMSLLNVTSPSYGDFTGVYDYQTALNAVIQAQDSFMELPADMRERFGNDPQKLLDFLADGKNRDEAIKLGLLDDPDKGLSTPPAKRASDSAGEAGGVGNPTPPKKGFKKPVSVSTEGGEGGE